MKIAIIHGYFLDDSGSAIYVRELTRELVRDGHELTLVCQEQSPQNYNFIDSYYKFDEKNTSMREIYKKRPQHSGSCKLVNPNLNGKLLTYVKNSYKDFRSTTFQEAPSEWIEEYIKKNIAALTKIFIRWPVDFIQTNHMVMQPYVTLKATENKIPYLVTIHGSAFNFTVKTDTRMVPYAIEGLKNASKIIVLSKSFNRDLTDFARTNNFEISKKLKEIPPGVNTELFTPATSRHEILKKLPAINPDKDDILVFSGRIIWTKGLHHLILALGFALQKRPNLKLIIAGDGPMKNSIQLLIKYLDSGDFVNTKSVLAKNDFKEVTGYGPPLPNLNAEEEKNYLKTCHKNLKDRIFFTGFLSHPYLAPVYSLADLTLAPSIFPEAFGLICIEALACGSMPVATYQSGLKSALDIVAKSLKEPALKRLKPKINLTRDLADTIIYLLDKYSTKDRSFNQKLHQIAEINFSWKTVAKQYIDTFIKSA